MSSEYIDEELQIMEEACSSDDIASGVDIEDPIRVLSLAPVISVLSGTTLAETINVLNSKKIGCVTVLDSKGETIGIFTERDVLRKIVSKNLDLQKTIVDEYMTTHPETLSENDPIAFALNRMSSGGYRHIPITRNREVRFMLSIKDIVDEISKTYRKRVLNLPPHLKQVTTEYGE